MRNLEPAQTTDEATTGKLRLHTSLGEADERLIKFVRALARCAAHRYIADAEKARAPAPPHEDAKP